MPRLVPFDSTMVKASWKPDVTPVAIGLVGGFAVTLGLAPVLRGLLFGISPTDVTILALTAAVLGSVAALAAYLPGHRAARVTPIVAMRAEV